MMVLIYVLLSVLTLACAVILLCVFLAWRGHKKVEHLPGPPLDSFFLGHLPSVLKYRRTGRLFSHYVYDCHIKYGLTFRLFILFTPMVCTCDPKSTREAKNRYPKNRYFVEKHFANFCGSRFIGRGLFSLVNQKEHRERRLFLNPAFHKTALLKLMKEFNASTTTLIEKLRELSEACPEDDGVEVIISDLIGKTTLDVIAKVAFGLELNSVKELYSEFGHTISSLFKTWSNNATDPLMEYNPWRQSEIAQAHRSIRFLRNFGQETIIKRKKAMLNGDKGDEEDILSMMLKYAEENPDYTIEEQVDDFLTFFVAGQETTAATLSSTLMFLDRNPEWKRLASREAEEVLGSKDNVDYSDLNSLTTTTNCLKESLRLAPPGTFLGIKPNDDFTIPPDPTWDDVVSEWSDGACTHRQAGKVISPGTRFVMSIYTMHRHPLFWSNAESFNPERWAPKTKETAKPMAYIPFSMGSRSCIGQVFAQMESKIILSRFLRAFDYESLDGHHSDEFEETLTLHLRRGLTIRLKPKQS